MLVGVVIKNIVGKINLRVILILILIIAQSYGYVKYA